MLYFPQGELLFPDEFTVALFENLGDCTQETILIIMIVNNRRALIRENNRNININYDRTI